MNRHVTAGTLAACLKAKPAVGDAWRFMKPGVTLQAELASFAANEKRSIGAAVRSVTGGATQHFHRSVLVKVWPALLLMTIEAA